MSRQELLATYQRDLTPKEYKKLEKLLELAHSPEDFHHIFQTASRWAAQNKKFRGAW